MVDISYVKKINSNEVEKWEKLDVYYLLKKI